MSETLQEYWAKRQSLNYYKTVREWIESIPPGNCIMDVGSRGTPIVTYGDFQRRISIDLADAEPQEGVENIVGDWMAIEPPVADLVICLQVLEHLSNTIVSGFAKKLLKFGKQVIISVPFMWPRKSCKYHKQDLISVEKLEMWVGKRCVKHVIVAEETGNQTKRIVALFDGDA